MEAGRIGDDVVVEDRVAELLRQLHVQSAGAPLVGASSSGAFPDRPGLEVLGLRVRIPPVVVDTNQLFRDVGYFARRGQRTVLVNAANSGALRILCPRHVVDEILYSVANHGDRPVEVTIEEELRYPVGAVVRFERPEPAEGGGELKRDRWRRVVTVAPDGVARGAVVVQYRTPTP